MRPPDTGFICRILLTALLRPAQVTAQIVKGGVADVRFVFLIHFRIQPEEFQKALEDSQQTGLYQLLPQRLNTGFTHCHIFFVLTDGYVQSISPAIHCRNIGRSRHSVNAN